MSESESTSKSRLSVFGRRKAGLDVLTSLAVFTNAMKSLLNVRNTGERICLLKIGITSLLGIMDLLYPEPSTSGAGKNEDERPSILAQKSVRGPFGSDYIKPIKAGAFRAKYPPKKRKKMLNFRETSESSTESIVTVLNGKKSKNSRESSGRHLSSGNRESDCYIEVSFENCGLRFTRGGESQGCWETWRCVRKTKCCKIFICFICGVILPSLIIVTVLFIREK